MYLKEIEMSGFKSFADKLKLTLDNNITCIVGPNGSGKSNVVDAVRWVLGEQSVKSLRGEGSMTDVIFSGSKNRNALNVASVSLIFDNSDHYLNVPYEEVAVKRRVYRSGENEYFLNGDKCRLKDITDLFIDSGIGKESFNIISQGEVQRILSHSSYERRIIFEEAAGVLKYKKRKEEAIRKLDRTHNNLDRVKDIILELESQLEPLQEQSAKAKSYLENKENLEKIEVALITYDIDHINEIYQSTKKRIDDLNEKIVTLQNTTQEVKVDKMKTTLLAVEEKLTQFNQDLLRVTREEERLNGERKLLEERKTYDGGDAKVHEQVTRLTELELKLTTELSLVEEELSHLNEDLVSLRKEENIKNQELSELYNQKEVTNKERSNHERERVELEHRIQLLENQLENGGNLPNSVQAVLNHPKLKGVYQVLGNLFETDEKYTKALEVALGSSKNFLVVENERVAEEAINYLKDNRLGRATFFPLNIIKPKGIDAETEALLENDSHYIGLASSLIKFDNKFRSVLFNQLGNILVVDTMAEANRISKLIHARYKIVTLDGEVIHVGGSMTGGSLGFLRSSISDKVELEKMKRRKQELGDVLTELDKKIKELDENIQKEEQKLYELKGNTFLLEEQKKSKLKEREEKLISLESAKKDLVSYSHIIDDSLSVQEEETLADYYDTVRKKEELILEIKRANKEKDNLQVSIDEEEAKQRLSNSELRSLESELKTKEIEKSKMDVQLDQILTTLSEDYELTYEKAKQNYVLELDPEDARKEVTKYKNNLKQIGMVNLEAIDEYNRVNERYQFLTKQQDDLLNAKETLLEIIDEMDDVMKEEFKTTFEAVNKEFQVVFKQLFKGGSASLELTDPDHLLETGVEIYASPPGKKLKSISVLSGGEMTLTAISLLFAILNVRSVPFCLFDEVEAALDEANVDHFGTYLDHYKDKTQFLLITHKKKTMEYAKTLYGITMQESGVSKLVSVRLENVKETA